MDVDVLCWLCAKGLSGKDRHKDPPLRTFAKGEFLYECESKNVKAGHTVQVDSRPGLTLLPFSA